MSARIYHARYEREAGPIVRTMEVVADHKHIGLTGTSVLRPEEADWLQQRLVEALAHFPVDEERVVDEARGMAERYRGDLESLE